jgi:hypothetical protein
VFSQKIGKEKSFDGVAGAENAAGMLDIFKGGLVNL